MAEDLRPADDLAAIPNEERLFIRFFAAADSVVPLPDGSARPMSGAFRRADRMHEPFSVDRSSVCTAEETRDRGGQGGPFHVAAFTAATARGLGLRLTPNPIPDGEEGGPNAAHALVHGTRPDGDGNLMGGLTNGEAERLARAARLVIITPLPE
jgi:hypothetical protein